MKTLILALVACTLAAALTSGAATAGTHLMPPASSQIEAPATGGPSGGPNQS